VARLVLTSLGSTTRGLYASSLAVATTSLRTLTLRRRAMTYLESASCVMGSSVRESLSERGRTHPAQSRGLHKVRARGTAMPPPVRQP
jgi:hypothetical protein